MDSGSDRRLYACRMAERYDRRRYHRRCRRRDRVSTKYSDSLFLHIIHGRFRIYGPCSIHNGQSDAPDRSSRKIFHPVGNGIRLQCAGYNGGPQHREPKQPYNHHSHQPVYVLLGAPPHLCSACRRVFREACSHCILLSLSHRNPRGCHHC